MAFCINCGAELFDTSKFCPECGTPVEKREEPDEITEKPIETVVVEDKTEPETKPEVLEEKAVVLEEKPSEDKDDDKEAVSDEALAENVSAEEILESIPDIKKLDGVSIPSAQESSDPMKSILDEAKEFAAAEKEKEEKEAVKAFAAEEKIIEDKSEKTQQDKSEADNESKPVKKKSKAGVVVLIIFILLIGAAAALYFMGMLDAYLPASVKSGTILGNQSVAETTVTEDTTYISEEISETELAESETSAPETESTEADTTSAELMPTDETEASESGAEGDVSDTSVSESDLKGTELRIMPDHVQAAANQISCEISLSIQGVSGADFTEDTLIEAEYTSVLQTVTSVPVEMSIVMGDTELKISADSYDSEKLIYGFSSVRSAVEEAGFASADIDVIRFRSIGAPADVSSVTFIFE